MAPRTASEPPSPSNPHSIQIAILAGGQSRRMGCDKREIQVAGKPLLKHVQEHVQSTGFPWTLVERDLIPDRGPIGGIYTALKLTEAEVVIFVSCDMPFVNAALIDQVAKACRGPGAAVFVEFKGRLGFPTAFGRTWTQIVERQIQRGQLALRELARITNATRVELPQDRGWQLFNINTPEDLKRAEGIILRHGKAEN